MKKVVSLPWRALCHIGKWEVECISLLAEGWEWLLNPHEEGVLAPPNWRSALLVSLMGLVPALPVIFAVGFLSGLLFPGVFSYLVVVGLSVLLGLISVRAAHHSYGRWQYRERFGVGMERLLPERERAHYTRQREAAMNVGRAWQEQTRREWHVFEGYDAATRPVTPNVPRTDGRMSAEAFQEVLSRLDRLWGEATIEVSNAETLPPPAIRREWSVQEGENAAPGGGV